MTRKTGNKLIITICLIFSCAMLSFGAFSIASSPGLGKLRVEVMTSEGAPLNGITVNIHRVASIEIKSGQLMFVPTASFTGVTEPWSGLPEVDETKALVDAFAARVIGSSIAPVKQGVTVDGFITFNELEIGLYMYIQAGETSGRYTFSAALVAVNGGDDVTVVIPKTQRPLEDEPPIYSEPPPTPPVTPEPPAPPSPSTPGDEPPGDLEIPEPGVPLDPFPPDEDLPQTGITNWDVLIIVFASLGIILVVLGLLNIKRSKKQQ